MLYLSLIGHKGLTTVLTVIMHPIEIKCHSFIHSFIHSFKRPLSNRRPPSPTPPPRNRIKINLFSFLNAVFTLNVNYIQLITIQSIILHSILFNYGSIHICENSNKLGRATSQSKVENKMACYQTAAMLFTAILDLEARRKAKEASKARRRKIRRLKQQQRMRQTTM